MTHIKKLLHFCFHCTHSDTSQFDSKLIVAVILLFSSKTSLLSLANIIFFTRLVIVRLTQLCQQYLISLAWQSYSKLYNNMGGEKLIFESKSIGDNIFTRSLHRRLNCLKKKIEQEQEQDHVKYTLTALHQTDLSFD